MSPRHALCLLPFLLLAAAPAAQALRCDSRVVGTGDRDVQVRQRCGAPFWTDEFRTLDRQGANGPYEVQSETVYESWYYNFGPQRLMVRLLFRDGVLLREDTLGYGVREIGAACNLDMLAPGLTSGEIVARCGAPASRRYREDTLVRRDGHGNERYAPQRREEWVYATGDGRSRLLYLTDGQLDSVESLGR